MLPTRDGVGASCIALPPGAWPTVLAFLQQRFAHVDGGEWLARMARGEVRDAQGLALAPDTAYRPHDKVYYYRSLPAEPRIPFDEEVLFQDDCLVAVDKPHFLPVTPGGRYVQETLLVRLKRRLGLDDLQPLHRLDRETAGLVLFGVQPAHRAAYHGLFSSRQVAKRYEAIAPFRPGLIEPLTHRSRLAESDSFMRMGEVPGEPNATTHIRLLERHGDLARYELLPETGRKHQLRVHLWALGAPIVGDQIYPVLRPEQAVQDFSQPLQLLAESLDFIDPVSGQARHFQTRRRLDFQAD